MKKEIRLSNSLIEWYKNKGYEIPVQKVQLYYKNNKGEKVKNGVKYRIANNTKLLVDIKDLPPESNERINFICTVCKENYSTQWKLYKNKKSPDKCTNCKKKELKGTGSHSYWVNKLIVQNVNAKCDISGETDKRFLILHHLLSRANNGKNEESNYVILSANYHMAFHVWNGGTNIPATPEQYYKFKQEELIRLK